MLLDGQPVSGCLSLAVFLDGAEVVTIEHLAEPGKLDPVQEAFIEEQAMQCGYCSNGWIMTAAALLERKPDASEEEIRRGLSGLKCRCGAHMSVLRAVKRAGKAMA